MNLDYKRKENERREQREIEYANARAGNQDGEFYRRSLESKAVFQNRLMSKAIERRTISTGSHSRRTKLR